MIKIFLRIQKMNDAQSELLKIINLIETRQEKLTAYKAVLRGEAPDVNAVKRGYVEIVRMSARIYQEIRVLKSIEKSLQRPFIFQQRHYDGDFMHQQVKRRRAQALEVFPHLEETPELNMFVTAEGTSKDVREMAPEEFMLSHNEDIYSSESEDEDDVFSRANVKSFKSMRKLNDQSDFGMKKQQSVDIHRKSNI